MNSEFRTLVVFDTSKLRSTTAGEVSYASFNFGSEFDEIKSFIQKNGLSDYVDVAIPELVIDEILKQKIEQYDKDIHNLSLIRQRLSELHSVDFTKIILPNDDFDCKEHLKPMVEEFIRNNNIKIITFPEEKLGEIFKNIIKRAIERKPPFKQSNKYSDVGFKDAVIWESILNYENLEDYNKVIFVSQDSVFNEKCKEEFKSKIGKHFSISSSIKYVIAELEANYQSFIEIKEWSDFANDDYFKSHISQFLDEIGKIPLGDKEYEVKDFQIINYIDSVEHLEEEEMQETGISTIIISLVKSTVKIDDSENEREVFIKVRTYLDDTKGFVDTDFEVIEDEGN